MVHLEVEDSSSSYEESDTSEQSSSLSDLTNTPTPPPEIYISVVPTGSRVRFNLATEDNERNAEVLRDVVHHENIVDFLHVPVDSVAVAPDGPEDPDHDYDSPPKYIAHFTDIRTLEEIIQSYEKPTGLPTSKNHEGVPEPLVWHVLTSILKALTFLHHGRKLPVDQTEDPEDWMPIVHNGIRPENIIFRHPIAKESTMSLAFRYGKCMLGDFSRSVVLAPPGFFGPDNPNDLTGADRMVIVDRREEFEHLYWAGEKHGFEAPEIVGNSFGETEYPGPWSDLWSLGALTVNMMTGHSLWDIVLEIEFEERAEAEYHRGEIEEDWRHASAHRRHERLRDYAGTARIVRKLSRLYSRNLRNIVEALLAVDPWDRGLALGVLKDVQDGYDKWRGKGFRMYEAEEVQRIKDEKWFRKMFGIVDEAQKFLDGVS